MMETVIFPDARACVISYLNTVMDVLVVSRVPSHRPDTFIRVLTAGGSGRVNPALDDVALTIEAWSTDEGEASDLAQMARALLDEATTMAGHGVSRYSEWGPPVDLPDESGQYRFTFTFSIRIRGTAA